MGERRCDSPFALSLINVITATQRTNFCIISGVAGWSASDGNSRFLLLRYFSFFHFFLSTQLQVLNATNVCEVSRDTTGRMFLNVEVFRCTKSLFECFSLLLSFQKKTMKLQLGILGGMKKFWDAENRQETAKNIAT